MNALAQEGFLNRALVAQAQKLINKWDFMKLRSFFIYKDIQIK